MKRSGLVIGLMLGLGLWLISCSGGNQTDGADANSLLAQVAPSEEEVLQIISAEAAKKAETEAASIQPQQAPPPDTIQFDLVLVNMWVQYNHMGWPMVTEDGDLGFIRYNFYYLDTAPDPDLELEGRITFNFVYQNNDFVPADPFFTIEFVAVTAVLQGSVVNGVIDALTPGVRDGFLRKVAVTAAADDGSVTRTATTNALGQYQMRIFGGGRTYTVKAFLNGFFEGVEPDVSLADGAAVMVDFDLLPTPDSAGANVQTISGNVTDLDLQPVAGATVYIIDRLTQETVPGADSCLTNAAGDYMIVAVPDGDYTFVANKGSKSGTADAVIPVGSSVVNVQIQDHRPVCAGITSNPNPPVDSGTSITFTCQASDLDDNVLYYDFHAGAGSFMVPGEWTLNTAVWMTPAWGVYAIDVVVSDGGLEATCPTLYYQVGVKDVTFDNYYMVAGGTSIDIGQLNPNEDNIPDIALGGAFLISNNPSVLLDYSIYNIELPPFYDGPGDTAIADFDQDGNLDAAFASGYGLVAWGDGSGNFQIGSNMAFWGGIAGDFSMVDAGLLNDDIYPDFVVSVAYSVEIRYYNPGTPPDHGSFGYYASVYTSPMLYPGHILIFDVNNDGWNDIIVIPSNGSGLGEGQVGILVNNAGSGFTPMVIDTYTPCNFITVNHGDLDGNGVEDVLATASCTFTPGISSSTAVIFYRDASGNIEETKYLDLGIPGRSPWEIAMADFNWDGIQDLVVSITSGYTPTSYYVDTIRVLLGMGQRTFSTPKVINAGFNPTSIGVADFNGDGKTDIAARNDYCGIISPECNSISFLINTTPID